MVKLLGLALTLIAAVPAVAQECEAYEYATFSNVRFSDTRYVLWAEAESSVQAESFADLITKLGGPADAPDSLLHLFNLIGSRGWQLSAMSQDEFSHEYYFHHCTS